MQIVSRIAVLFGVYSQALQQGVIEPETKVDVAVPSGSFEGPMAAWYARRMGLPIDNIICCCNENGAAWDLLRHGEMKTNPSVRKTVTPRYDVGRPISLERLIHGTVGLHEAQRYADICGTGGRYILKPEQHDQLRRGMFASVISDKRIPEVIANVYATNGYILCPYSALTYSGLMDYRAATGKNGPALLFCETSPAQCEDVIAKAMGIPVLQLRNRLDMVQGG